MGALPVGIQGHAVAEAPTGVARALLYLYIVRGYPFLLLSLLRQSYKPFYHTFHHCPLQFGSN